MAGSHAMHAFIEPPARIPWYLRLGIWFSERLTGKVLLPARLLAWYPRAALGSGVLESLIAHREGRVDERMLKLVRLQASLAISCPFCLDMNAVGFQKDGLSPEELAALQAQVDPDSVASFSPAERLALRYATAISQSPIAVPPELVRELRNHFSERELVVLASTVAQVNYWGRLIQALGIPPAGFSESCTVPPRAA
ncbi:MAG TPA: carboxymuconolactone decarboxylase family protein [Myxococcaceae bacterium]|nr:carboxymuconolactone decarboxylase family protein [Myxococcaceae bacterium]